MNCRLCSSHIARASLSFGCHPIAHHLQISTLASVEKFEFELLQCGTCGFVQVSKPIDQRVLYQNYLTPSSWKSQPHVNGQLNIIQNVLRVSETDRIIEIGCNDGSFLAALAGRGYKKLTGIEPTADTFEVAAQRGFDVINGFFNNDLVETLLENGDPPKLIVLRQVLEHISDINGFMTALRRLSVDGSYMLVEIPDSDVNFSQLDYSLWEEHVNYFTHATLVGLMSRYGFSEVFTERFLFSGATLHTFFEFSSTRRRSDVYASVENEFSKFSHYCDMKEQWQFAIRDFCEKEYPLAMYGAGGRSTNFIIWNGLIDYFTTVFDDQSEKQGLYLPGTELRVQPFEATKASVLLGVATENEYRVLPRIESSNRVYSVLPPSSLLPNFWKDLIKQ